MFRGYSFSSSFWGDPPSTSSLEEQVETEEEHKFKIAAEEEKKEEEAKEKKEHPIRYFVKHLFCSSNPNDVDDFKTDMEKKPVRRF